MNINVYMEDLLARQLSECSRKLHRKKNSIIREAVKDWLKKHANTNWPKSVVAFEGIEDFPTVDDLRKGVIEKDKKLF